MITSWGSWTYRIVGRAFMFIFNSYLLIEEYVKESAVVCV